MGVGEIIVIAVSVAIVGGAVALAIIRKKKGKTCCDCSDCSCCSHCKSKKAKDEN